MKSKEDVFREAIKLAQRKGWEGTPHAFDLGAFENGGDSESPNLGELIRPNYNILFDHGFARALFGEEEINFHVEDASCPELVPDGRLWMPVWKYHLQQMVISEDPVKYLEGHLKQKL